MLSSSPKQNGRRFSKTQRGVKFEENLDSGIINNWVTSILNEEGRKVNPNRRLSQQSNGSQGGGNFRNKIELFKMEYPVNDDMVKYDEYINSNNFNCFNLHNSTKKNSLYFMLQYVF